jgi:two-component system CheB/CheR fusion protein
LRIFAPNREKSIGVTKRQTPRKHAAQPKPPHAIAVRSKVDATKFAIIAVGASAGGLEAFTKLLEAFPPQSGVAIILVQHLDPTHKSLMASLLAPHTQMPVLEVITGTQIKPNTVYIIEPGTYLAIHNDILEVTTPRERHGARMPFDFLLQSLAEDCGERSVGVILSGNGTDGSIGLMAINNHGGLVIAQDPNEATHDSMPRSAIDTGLVHLILPIEKIPPSLARYVQQMNALEDQDRLSSPSAESVLHEIKAILQSCVGQDFAAYKSGSLMRRIARRMASQAIDDINVYLAFLRADEKEANILAKELLIHVTAFFRDTAVFELLAATVIPELVRQHEMDKPIRIWVPACSSGEEVYSLAMMFLEAITAAKKSIKLQIFGTDIDEQAVTTARAGRYPASLKAELSSERLARFFVEDGGGYRIGPSLRETVIFTVHDILVDPPFARIDFVSCRNLLIYLLPEAQQRVLSLLHFALRKGGVLLLGIAENIGSMRGDFDPVSDDLRIFRRAGGGYKFKALLGFNSQPRAFWPRTAQTEPQRTADLGDISRRALLDSYAPASVLIDQKDQGLYYFGSTDKYLQIPSGDASHSIHTMARPSVRHKLRAAIRRARSEKKFIAVSDGISERNGISSPLIIEVRPVENPDRELFLVSFIDAPQPIGNPHSAGPAEDVSKISALEASIEAIKKELQDTIQELETSYKSWRLRVT